MNAAAALRRDGAAWIAAAAGVFVLGAVFRPEIASAVTVWNSSTAYGHCWLVLPIVAWLLWERRGVLAAQPARPAAWAGLLAIPLVLAWWLSDLLGIMEGRQLAALGFVLLLLLAVLGARLWWALSAAFLYLVFLVPFGAFVTPVLQRFTAGSVVAGLRLLDIPFEADSFQITIPEGVFYVAEACAGLRFLIASVAFGVLYAVTMFRSPGRRLLFVAVSCAVPVLANGVRALGIVLLGHALGSARAGAADHLIYGWVFFSTVIVLLALAGLPFRQAPVTAASGRYRSTGDAGPPGRAVALAGGPVLVLALACPLLAGQGAPSGSVAAPAAPEPLVGCVGFGARVSGPTVTAAFLCGGQSLRLVSTALPHGSNPARVLDAARLPAIAGLGGDIDTEAWQTPGSEASPWMLVSARDTGRLAAYAVRVGGVQGVGGLRDRLRMLGDMLGRGTADPTIARSVTLEPGGADAEALLKSILTQLGPGRFAAGSATTRS